MTRQTFSQKLLRSKFTPPLLALFIFSIFFSIEEIWVRIVLSNKLPIDKSWWNQHVQKNQFNYRDINHKIKKSPGVFRILVLGDSQTVGHGIEDLKNTWPKRLEALLNSNLPFKRFEVINSAYQGWNTDTELYELFGNGFTFDPDLVLLGFYLNDIPEPANFSCSKHDKDFLNPILQYIPLGNKSKLFEFINFKLNRLSEIFDWKPTYVECLNSIYKSRSWELEKVYLDTIIKGTRLKNAHFMASIIPIFSQLGEDYPAKNIHSKVANYFRKNNEEVIDLWKETFFGMNASELIISEQDRHLNKKAAELIAQTIYKRLKPLKKLKHLHRYQKAVNLDELVSGSSWINELDDSFNNLEFSNSKIERIIFKENNSERFTISKKHGMVYFNRSHFDPNSLKFKPIQKTELNINGDLKKNELLFYSPESDAPRYWNSLIRENNKDSLLKFGEFSQQKKKIEKKNLKFIYKTHRDGNFLKLEVLKDVYFIDPKNLEFAFLEKTNPNINLSNMEMYNAISKYVVLNPHLFFDFKNQGYIFKKHFDQLTQKEQSLIYKEMEWTKYFFTLLELGHGSYINALITDILKYNPVPVLLKSIERFYYLNKRFKELNRLYQSYPTLSNRFNYQMAQK